MNTKRYVVTAITFALFAALLFYVAKYEKGGPGDDTPEEKTVPVWKLDAAKIIAVEWRYPDRAFSLSRKGPGAPWRFDAPAGYRPDGDQVAAAVDEAAAFEAAREIRGDPANYGLDKPVLRVSLTLAGGGRHTLRVGDAAPTGEKVYVMEEKSRRVFTAESWRVDQLRKNADDLRDRTIIDLEREKVTAITASKDGRTAECRKTGGDKWFFAGGKKSCADEADSLLASIQYARALEFVPVETARRAAGEKNQKIVLKLEIQGNTSRTLELGGQIDKDVYVENTQRDETYRIPVDLADEARGFLKAGGGNNREKEGD